jgi:hypothetical protein
MLVLKEFGGKGTSLNPGPAVAGCSVAPFIVVWQTCCIVGVDAGALEVAVDVLVEVEAVTLGSHPVSAKAMMPKTKSDCNTRARLDDKNEVR